MAKQSVYRDFIAALTKHWRVALPSIHPLDQSFGPAIPKASTFYAGTAQPLGLHVYVNFQHSTNSWQVGQFTINMILSQREGPPGRWAGPFAPDDLASLTEGSYRISGILGRKGDKWWDLKGDGSPITSATWCATCYDDSDVVLRAAVADVTGDVQAALQRLGVVGSDSSNH